MTPLLSISNLTISINRKSGEPIDIVSGLDLNIPEGTIFGLAGESGCGKSLTALSIMGILPPNMSATGVVNYKGTNLLKTSEPDLRALRGNQISMIFQEPMISLNPVLKVGFQIKEVLTTHLKLNSREADRVTIGLLRSVKIPAPEIRVNDYPHQLSGGMRQRVMIAMAIACSPALLIADEPTTALDVTIESQILELIRGLQKEKSMAVLMITHDLGIIAENAQAVAIMYAGRIVETASVEDLFRSPRHPYTRGLLNSLPKQKGTSLKPIPGSVPKPGQLPPGCKFSDRCEFMTDKCQEAEPELKSMQAIGHSDVGAFTAPNFFGAPAEKETSDKTQLTHMVRCIRAGEI